MTIETNITNRRELASALAQYMNTRAVYLGPPTFAYQIGDIHLSREGILSGDDLDGIFPFLEMQGIITAQPKMIREPAENTAPSIQIPLERYTPVNLRNLIITLYSKQWLIRKACCMPALHIPESVVNSMPTDTLESAVQILHDLKAAGALTGIDITCEQITFSVDADEDLEAVQIFLQHVVQSAKAATRVFPAYHPQENEKYIMHGWLIRMGLNGPDHKALRKSLMSNLRGNCAFRSATDLVVGFSLAVGILVFLFTPQIAKMMGAEGIIYSNCVIYGRILIAALPAFMLQILFQNFLVVAEKPQMGMIIAISSGVTNILLDALFVAVFRWGVAGAAAATVLGQVIGGLVPLMYFVLGKNHLLWFTKFRFSMHTVKRTCINGFSALIGNASNSLVGIVFNLRLMDLMGSDGVVAYGVVMYVTYIVTGVFMGYSTGIAPVFSYNLGAKNTHEIRGIFKKSLYVLSLSAVVLAAFVMAFARPLASIFVSYDDRLMNLTTEAIRLYSISFFLCSYNIFAASFFAALNNGAVSSILSLTRTLVFQMGCLFLLPEIIGSSGIWLSVTAAEILSLIVVGSYMTKYRNTYQYY